MTTEHIVLSVRVTPSQSGNVPFCAENCFVHFGMFIEVSVTYRYKYVHSTVHGIIQYETTEEVSL